MNRSDPDPTESPPPEDADDRLGRDELVSEVEGAPEEMRPPGEPGLVADAQQAKKRIDEEEEPGEEGEAEEPESPLAAEGPGEQDTGEQS